MRRSFPLLLIVSALGSTALMPVADARAQQSAATANASFDALSNRYVESVANFSPVYGTQLGDHRFDDRLPDISAEGRKASIDYDRAMLAALDGIDFASLSRDRQVDALLLRNALEYDLWDIEVLRSWSWNVQIYNDIAGSALYTLAARDFAPWDQRLKAATARMAALPAFLAESRRQIDPSKVPGIFASTVSGQNVGIIEIVETMLLPHAEELNKHDRARFNAAYAALKLAVADHQTWLDSVLVPAAKGDFRLGAELYDQKMKFVLMSSMSRDELLAKARQAAQDTRAEMYTLARKVLAGKTGAPPLPENPSAEQQRAAIEAALELSYANRPDRTALMDASRAALERQSAFVREKDLVTMPSAPVEIITMPKFQQGSAVAYCDSPGPLDKGQDTFFAISPIPDDWSDEQATSFLREYNDYMIQDLSIHEAMPGHWLQIDHSNQDHDVLRAILSSGPFVEGWAVYSEGVMKDAGYMDGDPLFQLTVLKMRLRSITNTILDIGIQTGGMSRDEAMDLMMKGAFQQEREAAGKWVRAQLSSTQLLSYFTGYEEHVAMRREAERRWDKDFNLKAYHDKVLSHGSPPARFVRELIFDLPIE